MKYVKQNIPKHTLKIFILLSVSFLGSYGAFAQTTTNVVINYPFYLYAYNNLESVTFDFTDNTSVAPGQADSDTVATKTASVASIANYTTCLEASIPNTALTQTATQGADAGFGTSSATTCSFAPSEVTNYSNFSVTAASTDADGWLLVVTNSTDWSVDANISTSFSNFSNSKLHVSPDFGTSYTNVLAAATDLGDQDDFYRTNRRRHYVLPLTFALELDPYDGGLIDPTAAPNAAISGTGTPDGQIVIDSSAASETAVVTYTFAVP